MKCLLVYYTGTFNTRYITNLIKDRFVKEGLDVDTYEIDPSKNERLDMSGYDLIGLGNPIYGFNTPWPFLKFVRHQKFPKGVKCFIYKNSGETLHANDASSVNVVRKLKHDKALIKNEYHFIMPYNIHFRFDEKLVKEMLLMDDLLLDILVKEVLEDIPNIKKYTFIQKAITFFVKLQFIGGDVNSYLYKVDKKACIDCGKCIKGCPMDNIYKNKKGEIKFHHHCLMCMRCSLNCPKNAIYIGYLEGWKVNGPYDFKKIRMLPHNKDIITKDTEGFFKCYIETYNNIRKRHQELFGE